MMPHGRSLPAAKFAARHRRLRRLLWLHAALLPLVSVVLGGHGILHDAAHGAPIVAFALISSCGTSRRLQAVSVAFGLLTASAVLVHAADGATEAHFHFFLMMSMLALYEDWLPYGIGVAFVFVHHALMGALAPAATFGHGGNALGLALIHAGFIMGAGVANVALWRANERAREMTTATLRSVRIQYEVTHVLAGAVTLDDAVPHLLRLIGERLGFSVGLFWTPEAGGRRLRASRTWHADERLAPAMREFRRSAVLECGEGIAGRAWRTGTATTSDVLAADTSERQRDVVALAGQQGAVALPIRRGDEVLGVLAFTSERSERPGAETIELLSSLSTQLALFMDRVQRADEAARFADAALTDALTGLANRRAWDASLPAQVEHADREGAPLCLALLDLDHFKDYNDTHGHQAGDELLRIAAARWRSAVRDEDVLARYGGEEFAVALPGCTLDEAVEIAERLRGRVPGGATCSIGVAVAEPGEDPSHALARADRALYAAKAAGRDRVVVAAPALV